VAQREEDRRRHPRFQCGGEAEIRTLCSGHRAQGKIINLSVGGCLIQLEDDHNFRRGEGAEMTFCVRQLPLRVQGSIRQTYVGQAVGVEFTVLTERGKRQLLQLIEELAEILKEQVGSLTGGSKSSEAR
jgi:PilZ domain